MKKRGVLSLWKTIMLVFAGIISVAGVTTLGVYLSGGFDKNPVPPQDITIEKVVDGQGLYNDTLDRLEVSSDFWMTVSTTTEGVTEKEVELSLKGGELKNGKISDGVITIPQKAKFNTPFKVEIKQIEDDNDMKRNVGGNSILYADASKSNIKLLKQEIKIAVDVGVRTIEVKTSNSQEYSEDGVYNVAINSTFSLDTKFTPTESELLFMDEETPNRKKQVFYEVFSSAVEYNDLTGKFTATKLTTGNNDLIKVYTFKNSYYQEVILEKFKSETDPKLKTSRILAHFAELEAEGIKAYESTTIHINVSDIDVDNIIIGLNEKTIDDAYVDQYYKIETGLGVGNHYLGAEIKSGDITLDSLMGGLAIKIPQVKHSVDALTIKGGDIIKVVTTTDVDTGEVSTEISRESYVEGFEYWNAPEGTSYYVLADTTPTSTSKYNWQFASAVDSDSAEPYVLYVNFFFVKEGKWTAFFNMNGTTNIEKKFYMEFNYKADDESPSWKEKDIITMTIRYKDDGTPDVDTVNLSNAINNMTNNLYSETRYFLFLDEKDSSCAKDIDLQKIFNCMAGVKYSTSYDGTTLKIPSTAERDEGAKYYTLYEVDGSILIAKKSFSGKVKMVVATIRKNADNEIYYDENDENGNYRYMLVSLSMAREIEVVNSLSIYNMTPTFSFDAEKVVANADGEYYISAKNINESGQQQDVIFFQLVLSNSEDTASDALKIRNAFNSGDLSVVCCDENGIEYQDSYLKLEEISQDAVDEMAHTVTFKGTLKIQETFFSAGITAYDQGTKISLKLVYDDGSGDEPKVKALTLQANDTVGTFTIYYPQPVSVEATYEENYNAQEQIVVENKSTSMTITWGAKTLTLDDLNNQLKFKLIDQMGNEIDSDLGIFSVKFVENAGSGNTNLIGLNNALNQILNFASTQGTEKTTTLNFVVVDKDGKECYQFDESGNIKKDNDGNPIKLASNALSFKVISEGVTAVYKLPDEFAMIENNGAYTIDTTEETGSKFIENAGGNVGSVTIKKTVTKGDKFSLNQLVRVYTDTHTYEDNPNAGLEGIKFYLDSNYYSTYSPANKQNILHMISFDTTVTIENPEGHTPNIEDYYNKQITAISVLQPFKDDTQMMFVVTDANENLFEILLTLTLKSDMSITANFASYYEENQDYLVQNGNAVGVFADRADNNFDYDLSEYLTLSSAKRNVSYSWSSAIGNYIDNQSQVFESDWEGCKLVRDDVTGKIYLSIDPIYEFKTVNLTVYYGVASAFVCSVNFSLYINPNIVIEQKVENSLVDINKINDTDVSNLLTYYSFYKATQYIQGVYEEVSLANVAYKNLATNDNEKYIKIENGQLVILSGEISDFVLGKEYEQTFSVVQGIGAGAVSVDAITVYTDAEGQKTITKCKPNAEKETDRHAKLTFNLVYGGSDAYATASALIVNDATGENVEVISYNGKNKLLLLSNQKYATTSGATIDANSITGNLTYSNSKLIPQTLTSYVSTTNNTFVVTTSISSTGSTEVLKLKFKLDAFVSMLGNQFVKYDNYVHCNMDKGSAKLVDLATLLGNYTGLETYEVGGIYQELLAGKTYTISHNETIAKEDGDTDIYGFYYNETLLDTANGLNVLNISICTEARGYIDGLAEVSEQVYGQNRTWKLKINDLASLHKDTAFIVLKCEMSGYGMTNFTYYYRIKVKDNFETPLVTYPYAEDGEYLDSDSPYCNLIKFDEGTDEEVSMLGYQINLDEVLNPTNSRFENASRFGSIDFILQDNESLIETYEILKVNGGTGEIEKAKWEEYFVYTFENTEDGTVLKIALIDNSTKLAVVIQKSVERIFDAGRITETDDQITKMIGSEQQYTFLFNQGTTYVHTLKQTIGGKEKVLETNTNTYNTSVKAGSGEVSFVATIKKEQDKVQTPVNEYDVYIKYAGEIAQGKTEADYLIGSLKYKYVLKAGTYKINGLEVVLQNDTIISEVIADDAVMQSILASNQLLTQEMVLAGIGTGWETQINAVDKYLAFVKSLVVIENGQDKTLVDMTTGATAELNNYLYMTFAILNSDKTLVVNPQDSVAQDQVFEIGYYADEKVVFKLNLSVESYLTIRRSDPASGYVGGNQYDYFDKTNTIAPIFDVKLPNTMTVTSFVIELKDDDFIDNSNTIKYSNLVKIETDNGNNIYKISFAQLTQDVTFKFKATITDSEDKTFTFDFEMFVQKSFDTKATRVYDVSSTAQIAGTNAQVNLDAILNQLKINSYETEHYFILYQNVGGDIVETADTYEFALANVGEETTCISPITIVYKFDSNTTTLFSFVVSYKYKVKPNVTLETNYPAPDGIHEVGEQTNENGKIEVVGEQTEYISTTTDGTKTSSSVQEAFFTSPALLGKGNRIAVSDVTGDMAVATAEEPADNTEEGDDQEGGEDGENEEKPVVDTKTWTINVSEISTNVEILVSGTTEKKIVSNSTNKNLCTNVTTETVKGINLQFALIDTSQNGTVTFEVIVNEVPTTYSVTIVAGNVFSVVTNAPSFAGNTETIYAEDVAGYTEKTIFANDRILQYTLNEDVTAGTVYYLKFTHVTDGTTQIVKIKADNAGRLTNFDAGKSMTNYTYTSAYRDELLTLPVSIFADGKTPIVTSRIVPYYYNGTQISTENYSINLLKLDDAEDVNGQLYKDYTLTADAYAQTQNLKIELKIKTLGTTEDSTENGDDEDADVSQDEVEATAENTATFNYISANINSNYNIKIDIELDVTGVAEDTKEYTTVKIDAGKSYKLLSLEAFGITNTRYNQLFNTELLKNTNGSIDLQIYGIGAKVLDDGNANTSDLSEKALNFHKYFKDNIDVEGIKYYTGIFARYGQTAFDTNGFIGGTTAENYVLIAEDLTDGKALDYTIVARGANNDGNHVMMCLTYTVDIGAETPITKSFNILFKVMPNSSIAFKNSENSAYAVEAIDEVEEYRTIATNSADPYLFESGSSNTVISLFDTEENSNTVVAKFYGSTQNSAGLLKYSITKNSPTGYNDANFVGEKTGFGSYQTTARDVSLTINKIAMGERKFVVEIENEFGYKIKFYITGKSGLNPQLSLSSNTLVEGETLAFGANYKDVTLPTDSEGNPIATYNFTYVEGTSINITNGKNVVQSAYWTTTINTKEYKADLTLGEDEGSADYTIEVEKNKNDKLTPVDTSDAEKVDMEDGMQMQLTLVLKKGNENALTYGVKNGNTPLTTSYLVSETYSSPTYKADEGFVTPEYTGTLSAIDAYAFNVPIDTNSLNGVTSKLTQNMYISAIEYYTEDGIVLKTQEFTEKPTVSIKENPPTYSNHQSAIITNDKKSFATGGAEAYVGYSNKLNGNTTADGNTAIKIPNMPGYYYGTGNEIKNIKMVITLTDGSSTCIFEKWVTIQREQAKLFEDTVTDNTEIKAKTNARVTDIFNDTLEVTLQANSSVTFAIDDAEIDSIKTDANGYTLINMTENTASAETIVVDEGVAVTFNTNGGKILKDDISRLSLNENYVYKITDASVETATLTVPVPTREGYRFAGWYTDVGCSSLLTPNSSVDDNGTPDNTDDDKTTIEPPTISADTTLYAKWDKIAKLVTLENGLDYAVTEYVSISGYIQGLTENWLSGASTRNFNIYVTDYSVDKTVNKNASFEDGVTFEYAGEAIDLTKITEQQISSDGVTRINVEVGYAQTGLQQIKNMAGVAEEGGYEEYYQTLNIDHVDQISTSSKTLYFLYSENDQTYRTEQTFDVVPLFEKATIDTTDITVVDYIKMSYGTSTYYVLPFDSWASQVKLYKHSTDVSSAGKLSAQKQYQFYYEIDNIAEGGSGFVDENGTITTTTNLNIGSHYITIKIYMKVSGNDGLFEEANTKLSLGSFRILLGTQSGTDILTSDAGDYYLNNNLITVQNEFTATGKSDDTMQSVEKLEISYTDDKGTSDTSDDETITQIENVGAYSFGVGETIDFKKIFEDEFGNNYTNLNYHITHNGTNSLVSNNLNSYSFESAGKYECTFVLSGRSSSTSFEFKQFKATIVVFETSVSDQKTIEIEDGETYNLDNGYTWYKVGANNDLTEITGGAYVVNTANDETLKLGLNVRNFIGVSTDGKIKNMNINFYVYSNPTTDDNGTPDDTGDDITLTYTKTVALRSSTTFYLKTIFGEGVEIYRVEKDENGLTKVTYENFAKGESWIGEVDYVVIRKDDNQNVVSSTLWTITYKIMPSSVIEDDLFVEIGEISHTTQIEGVETLIQVDGTSELTINNAVKNYLNQVYGESNYSVEEFENNSTGTTAGILKNLSTSEIDGVTTNYFERQYLVTVKTGDTTKLYRYVLNFYAYVDEFDVGYQTAGDVDFDLSKLNSLVREKVEADTATAVSFYDRTTLQLVDAIVLQESKSASYLVMVGEQYYLFNIDFLVKDTKLGSIEFAKQVDNSIELSNLDQEIRDEVYGKNGNGTSKNQTAQVCYYLSTGDGEMLVQASAGFGTFEYYVFVDGKAYDLKLNLYQNSVNLQITATTDYILANLDQYVRDSVYGEGESTTATISYFEDADYTSEITAVSATEDKIVYVYAQAEEVEGESEVKKTYVQICFTIV